MDLILVVVLGTKEDVDDVKYDDDDDVDDEEVDDDDDTDSDEIIMCFRIFCPWDSWSPSYDGSQTIMLFLLLLYSF